MKLGIVVIGCGHTNGGKSIVIQAMLRALESDLSKPGLHTVTFDEVRECVPEGPVTMRELAGLLVADVRKDLHDQGRTGSQSGKGQRKANKSERWR